jgi:hypothetical protein
MRVLVTWGAHHRHELKALGVEAALMPASNVRDLRGYDAAIIGGALMNRWRRDARHLVARHIAGASQCGCSRAARSMLPPTAVTSRL